MSNERYSVSESQANCNHTFKLNEPCNEKKSTTNYLSSVLGKYSQVVITENDREACTGKMVRNSISELNHASSTLALITGGMIRLDHAAGEG
jgi:hypothetical protein